MSRRVHRPLASFGYESESELATAKSRFIHSALAARCVMGDVPKEGSLLEDERLDERFREGEFDEFSRLVDTHQLDHQGTMNIQLESVDSGEPSERTMPSFWPNPDYYHDPAGVSEVLVQIRRPYSDEVAPPEGTRISMLNVEDGQPVNPSEIFPADEDAFDVVSEMETLERLDEAHLIDFPALVDCLTVELHDDLKYVGDNEEGFPIDPSPDPEDHEHGS